ncbi:MAG: sodium:proton antiporter [Planctomycetes bacterium]|nr:sodium:proton antiporter [Planctomycetota bacterium]
MKKVALFSGLLLAGLAGSQWVAGLEGPSAHALQELLRVLTMLALGFIMIHVGYEFEIDRARPKQYAVDYGIAATAAAFPWIFCALYFVFVLGERAQWGSFDTWKEALLTSRFAAPTSAGILFSMLAAAGLSATWLFRKARVLAIFDDLDTVLFMIPLKMMIVGLRWQLAFIVLAMVVMLWLAWRYLHALRWPVTWPWVLTYAALIVGVSEAIYKGSKLLDDTVPVHIEVLLPAFVLGCMLARPAGHDPHVDDAREGHQEGPPESGEQRVATIVSAAFMVLVGLSMPKIELGAGQSIATITWHVAWITLLANLGKMYPLFCYHGEASFRERLALCVGMWPRGEVGAGVLAVSLGYGIAGLSVTVAVLSLALNLVLTGAFIVVVKRLLRAPASPAGAST